MTLFKCTFYVSTRKGHPLFYERNDHGFVLVWLFASNIEEALGKAARILGDLPYEIEGQLAEPAPAREAYEPFNEHAAEARSSGFAMFFWSLPLVQRSVQFGRRVAQHFDPDLVYAVLKIFPMNDEEDDAMESTLKVFLQRQGDKVDDGAGNRFPNTPNP
jgi:hypothetical protein